MNDRPLLGAKPDECNVDDQHSAPFALPLMTRRFYNGSLLANWALFSGVWLVEGISLLSIAIFSCLYIWFDHFKGTSKNRQDA